MNVGERLTQLLHEYGVDVVFGVPGGQTLALYEGIKNSPDPIRHILVRDERTAVFAADAYARMTGKTGVCDATVGPGATNLPSGIAEAYASSIPLVAIIADIPRGWEHRKDRGSASQGMHQLAMFAGISKWAGVVNVPEAIDDIVDSCFRIAHTGRPGPTILCIPDDVFSSEVPESALKKDVVRKQYHPWHRSSAHPDDIRQAARILQTAAKPAIFAGGGVHLSAAYEPLTELAELLQAPVATTISGKGAISERHPLAVGVAGSMGRAEVNDMLKEADAVLVVGNKLGQVASLQWEVPTPGAKVIHLDIDGSEIGKNIKSDVALVGDASTTLHGLLAELKNTSNQPEEAAAARDWDAGKLTGWQAWKDAAPERLQASPAHQIDIMRILSGYTQPDDVLVCDASLASSWAAAHWVAGESGRRYIAPRGLAGLGYGAPAAIGAALGRAGGERVVCLAGDGAWAYSMQEVETMHRLKLPILIVVINNRILGWVKHVEKARFNDTYISTDFAEVDYAKAAEAMGARAYRVWSTQEFADCLAGIGSIDGPVFIEVSVTEWDSPVLRNSSSVGEF